MSTVTETPANPVFKYESYVESQLGKAQSRIRLLDLAVAGLILVGGTLLYAVTMAFLDRVFELPSIVRQSAFGLYVLAALVFVGVALSRIVFRRVNPYYAALQVEHGLEDVKNSVVNWLDLRERELPAAIRNAVSQRAAKDLARADLDQLLSTRWTRWIGAVTGGLLLSLIVLFFLSPPQFFSLLKRSFVPFTEGTLATRTQLTLLQPEGGDVTVAVGRAVTFAVGVDGRVPEAGHPDSVRLRYRYQPTDPYVERPLAPADSSRHWNLVLPAGEVRHGFWYTVAGGDAETPEYRVQVRSTPLVTGTKVTYEFRKYLNRPDQTSDDPNLEGVRGTKVTIAAQTNRTVRDGQLEFTPRPGADGKPKAATITPAQRVADDPRALSFQQIVLVESGTYRVWFTAAEGEKNADPVPHTVRVLDDEAPKVVLTKPGQPVSLPANGTLSIEGAARDDFGLAHMTLKMEIEGQEQSKPYRPGKSFQFENGNYPLKLDYKDVLELEKIKQANGQGLQPGASIEYWLEAADNYDYPQPNIGKSERFKITISPPESDPEKKQEQQRQRQREKNEQQQHEQKQDQDLNQENQNQKDQSGRGDKNQNSDPSKGDNQGESDKNLEDQKKKIEDAINEQEKQEEGEGKNDSKDQKENKESKGDGQKGDGAQDQKENKESKGDGQKGDTSKDQKENKESKGDGAQDQKENKESMGDGQKGDTSKDQKENKESKGDGAQDRRRTKNPRVTARRATRPRIRRRTRNRRATALRTRRRTKNRRVTVRRAIRPRTRRRTRTQRVTVRRAIRRRTRRRTRNRRAMARRAIRRRTRRRTRNQRATVRRAIRPRTRRRTRTRRATVRRAIRRRTRRRTRNQRATARRVTRRRTRRRTRNPRATVRRAIRRRTRRKTRTQRETSRRVIRRRTRRKTRTQRETARRVIRPKTRRIARKRKVMGRRATHPRSRRNRKATVRRAMRRRIRRRTRNRRATVRRATLPRSRRIARKRRATTRRAIRPRIRRRARNQRAMVRKGIRARRSLTAPIQKKTRSPVMTRDSRRKSQLLPAAERNRPVCVIVHRWTVPIQPREPMPTPSIRRRPATCNSRTSAKRSTRTF